MEQQAIITNEKLNSFCNQQQKLIDKVDNLVADMQEVKTSLENQRNDFAKYRSDNGDAIARMGAKLDEKIDVSSRNICSIIGEVPNGRSVMGCVRDQEDLLVVTNHRIDKWNWTFAVAILLIETVANFPRIVALFAK